MWRLLYTCPEAPRLESYLILLSLSLMLIVWVGVFGEISERSRAKDEVNQLNSILLAVRNVNQLIAREKDPYLLLQKACDLLVESRGYHNIWVALLNPDNQLVVESQAGISSMVLNTGHPLLGADIPHCVKEVLSMDNPLLAIESPLKHCKSCSFVTSHESLSALAARLEYDGKVYGVMVASVPYDFALGQEEQSLFEELAGDIGYALYTLSLDKERQASLELLRESETRLKLAFEAANDGLWDWNVETGAAYFSPRYYTMLGYEPAEFPANFESWRSLIHPDDINYALKIIQDHIEQRLPQYVVEFRMRTKSGDWRWIMGRGKVFTWNDEGKAVRMIGTHSDISAIKAMESVLRESREQYRSIINSAPNAILIHQQDQIVFVNPAAVELLGARFADELVGMSIYGMLHPDYRNIAYQRVQTVYNKEGFAPPIEEKFIRLDAVVIDVEVTASPIDYEGHPASQVVFRDITAHKQVEAERASLLAQVQEQAQRIQLIIDTMPEGVVLLNAERHIVLTNPSAKKYLCLLTGGALLQQTVQPLAYLGARPLEELLTSPPKGEWHHIVVEDKPPRYFDLIARAIETGPLPGGWVLVLRDVTLELETRRRAQQQERLASIGQLAAGIAHDFNNIMAVIILYSQMLLRADDLSPSSGQRLRTISEQAHRATELIDQILDFSRRTVLESRPLELVPFLKEFVKLLCRTLREDIKVQFIYAEGSYVISADPTRIQQVVMNLAVNARDAMPDGGDLTFALSSISFTYQKESPLSDMPPGTWVQLDISDTGTGIPENVLPHIFEPFFTTKELGKGSGLGLAQVHGIVGAHNGYIDVHTVIGQGTTFTIYLPALSSPSFAEGVLDIADLPLGAGQFILLVEDDTTTRSALADSLELLNYQVLTAKNGLEALLIIAQRNAEIAVVLSDVVMPEMGGIALLHTLRSKGIGTKVILLTGHPLGPQLEELRASGLTDWMLKPPTLEKLAEVLACYVV
ncbi:MAG: PAS domain S-box protein [Anaerolineae bacterium]|nr:PAS domain S-box protein [Anaerolineae bacterium]